MSQGTLRLLPRIDKHLVAISAAAAAGVCILAVAEEAQAVIVHSGLVNINIPSTLGGVYLNVVTGAFGTAAATPGWDLNPWSSTVLNMFSSTTHPFGPHVGTGTTYFNLASGADISAASTYGGTGTNTINPGTPLNLNSDQNLVGFRFINELNADQIHYGWMRISLSSGAATQPRAIVEYAYESQAGVGIPAGAIPEPGSLSLLAVGALGLMRRRSRI